MEIQMADFLWQLHVHLNAVNAVNASATKFSSCSKSARYEYVDKFLDK